MFADAKIHNGNSTNPLVTYGDDSGLYVEFVKYPEKQEFLSIQEARPIYKDVDYIRISFPGDRTKEHFKPVNLESTETIPSDPVRFPRQWAAFQAQQEQVQEGTPLTEWTPMARSEALNLKALHIHTVEALSSIPDTALTWLGAREMREKAKTWLAQAKDGKEALRLMEENRILRDDIDMLKKQVSELASLAEKKKSKE